VWTRGAGARRGSVGRGDAPGDLRRHRRGPRPRPADRRGAHARSRCPRMPEPTASQVKQAPSRCSSAPRPSPRSRRSAPYLWILSVSWSSDRRVSETSCWRPARAPRRRRRRSRSSPTSSASSRNTRHEIGRAPVSSHAQSYSKRLSFTGTSRLWPRAIKAARRARGRRRSSGGPTRRSEGQGGGVCRVKRLLTISLSWCASRRTKDERAGARSVRAGAHGLAVRQVEWRSRDEGGVHHAEQRAGWR